MQKNIKNDCAIKYFWLNEEISKFCISATEKAMRMGKWTDATYSATVVI